jgi:hypothetical protein
MNVNPITGIVTTLDDGTSRVRRYQLDHVKSEENAGDSWKMNEDLDLDDEEDE